MNENRFTGQVGSDVYKFYFKNGGVLLTIFIAMIYFLNTSLRFGADWFVGQWSKNRFEKLSVNEHIFLYAVIVILFVFMVIVRSFTYGFFTSQVSYNVFKKLIWNIMRRKMEFFDTTPSGQIINRCSEDMEVMDQTFPIMFGNTVEIGSVIVCSFLFAIIVEPFVFIIIMIDVCLFKIALKKYLRSSTELRRLTQMGLSPIISKVSELMNGRVIIRSYEAKEPLLKIWEKYHDQHKVTYFHERMTNIWLHIRIELVIVSVVCCTGLLVVLSKNYE